jgi:hypothetical protein
MLILTALLAAILSVLVYVLSIIQFVEQDYYRQEFIEGRVTREQARERVGQIVDTWPAPNPSPN